MIARSVDAVMYSSNSQENEEKFFGFEMLGDADVSTGTHTLFRHFMVNGTFHFLLSH